MQAVVQSLLKFQGIKVTESGAGAAPPERTRGQGAISSSPGGRGGRDALHFTSPWPWGVGEQDPTESSLTPSPGARDAETLRALRPAGWESKYALSTSVLGVPGRSEVRAWGVGCLCLLVEESLPG